MELAKIGVVLYPKNAELRTKLRKVFVLIDFNCTLCFS